MDRHLTEPQSANPHKTCSHCGYCLVWVTGPKSGGKGNRRLSCLLCKARKVINILYEEVKELRETPVIGFTDKNARELERRYLDGENLIDLINELGDRTSEQCGESTSTASLQGSTDSQKSSPVLKRQSSLDLMSVL